jgi:hypothetical protein
LFVKKNDFKIKICKMKKQLKNSAFYLTLVMFAFILMSSGGGTGGGKGKSPTEGGSNEGENTCPTKIIPLVLFQGNLDPYEISNREFGFMPNQNILNGGQATSPSSIYEDTYLSYCHITITATNCNSYGNGGTKSFVWDSSNDGDNYDSSMNIEIPSNGSFTITIDLHDGCGAWYSGSNPSRRAMWIHQGNYTSSTIISIATWSLNRVDNC